MSLPQIATNGILKPCPPSQHLLVLFVHTLQTDLKYDLSSYEITIKGPILKCNDQFFTRNIVTFRIFIDSRVSKDWAIRKGPRLSFVPQENVVKDIFKYRYIKISRRTSMFFDHLYGKIC